MALSLEKKLRGYDPPKLNTFETAICEAWGQDVMAVIVATGAWCTKTVGGEMARELYPKMLDCIISGYKRNISPLAACLELRDLLPKMA